MKTLKLLCQFAVSIFLRVFLRIVFCVLPIKKNRVLFVSYRGEQYSCNPKYISEKLNEIAGDKLEIGWGFHEPEKFGFLEKSGIIVLNDRKFRFILFALTSRVIVTNAYYKPHLPRRRGQYFILTWHGGGAYKRVGGMENLPRLYKAFVRFQQTGASLYLSSSEAFTRLTVRESFGYYGEVMEKGMPRNDILIEEKDESAISEIKSELGIKPTQKLVLYAPTYSQSSSFTGYDLDFENVTKALSRRFGGEFVFAFRGHRFDFARKCEGIINASDYPDMQRLLLAADVLITDYSSCIWDMSLTHKPVFLYATDLDEYISVRNFYTDIHTWGFPLARNNAELISNIQSFDEETYRKNVNRHHTELGICESGHASELAARRIIDVCGGLKK